MLTPNDIWNPTRKSGYDHVVVNEPRPGSITTRKFRAQHGSTPSRTGIGHSGRAAWQGTYRTTAYEAAQDYCDYVNGGNVATLPAYAAASIDMGNATVHAPKAEPVKVIRQQHTGPTDLYDVLFWTHGGDLVCRKVGVTSKGHLRYADVCATLGLRITPFKPAVTYPTLKDARVAEDALVAKVCTEPDWTRIGKESFAFIGKGGPA